jgi:steroid delta-isomerase-like uncharacterized protein
MLDQNKDLARKYIEQCWNKGQMDAVDQLVSKDCRIHDPVFPSLSPGADSLKRHIQMCRTAFPDLKFTIDDIIAERDEVVVHWTARGTQQNPFLGVAPTHRAATVSGTSIYRIKNNMIVEQWADWNLMTLLDQLGVATTPRVTVSSR